MSEEKPIILSQRTLIPIGVFTILAGGIVWLTTIFVTANNAYNLAQQNAQSIAELQAQVNENNTVLLERTAAIGTKVDLILETLKQ